MKLKPCPFCGEEVDVYIKDSKDMEGLPELKYKNFCYAICYDCGARTEDCWEHEAPQEGFKDYIEQATCKWNRRKGETK